MTQTTPPRDASNEPAPREPALDPPRSRARQRWLVLAIGVGAAALAYGIGRVQGALALGGAEEAAAKDRAARQAQLGACQADRVLLEARRSLALVAIALDRRNFGVAETQRRRSLQMLEQASAGGIAEASSVVATVRALDIGVDPDPSTKREGVIAASEALDRLVVARGAAGEPPPPTP